MQAASAPFPLGHGGVGSVTWGSLPTLAGAGPSRFQGSPEPRPAPLRGLSPWPVPRGGSRGWQSQRHVPMVLMQEPRPLLTPISAIATSPPARGSCAGWGVGRRSGVTVTGAAAARGRAGRGAPGTAEPPCLPAAPAGTGGQSSPGGRWPRAGSVRVWQGGKVQRDTYPASVGTESSASRRGP